MWSYIFPKTICWNDCPFPFKGLSLLLKIIWHFMWVSFWNLLLFSIGLCLPLCQYHIVLMTETLQLVLKLGNMRPPTLFLFFNIIVYMGGGLLNFYMNFRMNFYISVFPISCRLSNVLTYNCSQYSSNPYFCQIINNSLLFLILVIWAFFFLFFGQSR